MLKRSRHSALLSYLNYAFIRFKRRKHKPVTQARYFANLKFEPDPKSSVRLTILACSAAKIIPAMNE